MPCNKRPLIKKSTHCFCSILGALRTELDLTVDFGSIIVIKNNSSIPTICEEIGARLKRLRLNENLTQTQLGERCGTSRKLIAKAELGRGDLTVIIAMLKVLGQAEQLNLFLPPVLLSPLQLWQLQGKTRQRASGLTDYEQPSGSDW